MRYLLILLLAIVALVFALTVAGADTRPVTQESLIERRVYAYRDWQSLGLRVHPGDIVTISADGEWSYTPNEYHGPEGHPRYRAPSFYPLPNVPGGVLLARIGQSGGPLLVGRQRTIHADRFGTLYFRIDDDILGDNDGYVVIDVTIESPAPED